MPALDPNELDFKAATKYLPVTRGVRTFEQDVLDLIEASDSSKLWLKRYAGPLPATGDSAGWAMLEKSIAPILKNRECVGRHVRGVVGREPAFETVLPDITELRKDRRKRPSDTALSESEQFADDADKVQGDVFDERGEHKIVKTACKRLISIGKTFLRYDIPPGLLVQGPDLSVELAEGEDPPVITGVEAGGKWEAAYRLTYMEVCPRGSAAVFVDPSTMRRTSFYSYVDEDKVRCIQVSWVDADGMTQVRVLKSKGDPDEWEVDCGGRLLVEEAELEPLVTPATMRIEDIASSTATMVKVNADVAGFPQVDAIDIAEPTAVVPAPTEEEPNATKRVPATLPTGARTIRATYSEMARDKNGDPLVGDDGKPILRQGRLQYRDPVSSQPLRDDIEFFNTEIYSAFHQRHIPARTSANASAEMLIEMRADYADSLLETKPDLEKLLRNVFKGRLCMAAYLANDTEALKKFKAGKMRVDLHLNAGPLSVAEKQFLVTQWDKGVLSLRRLMVLLGDADDVEAEIAALLEDKKAELGDRSTPVPRVKVVPK